MRRVLISLCLALTTLMAEALNSPSSVNLAEATIVYNDADAPLVKQMAQVLENRKEFTLTLPLDKTRHNHTITLSIIDPGQIIQKITYQ